MTLPACAHCGSRRAPDLATVAPCEYCGADSRSTEEREPAPDDSWSGGQWRERCESTPVTRRGKVER